MCLYHIYVIHLCIDSRSPANTIKEILTFCSAALVDSSSLVLKYLFRVSAEWKNSISFPFFSHSSDKIIFFPPRECRYILHLNDLLAHCCNNEASKGQVFDLTPY